MIKFIREILPITIVMIIFIAIVSTILNWAENNCDWKEPGFACGYLIFYGYKPPKIVKIEYNVWYEQF